MTEVLLVGRGDEPLRQQLLGYETARRALSAYDLREPYADTLAVETISLGQAVSLLNDLDWYLARTTEEALVREPSVSETEWLARPLARAVRDGELEGAETATHLKVYGVVPAEPDGEPGRTPPRLVEPMYVTRTERGVPAYDLRDVTETVVVRVPASAGPGAGATR